MAKPLTRTGFDSRARRPAVIRGSESPPDSHSLPLLLQIPPPYNAKTPPKNRGCFRMVQATGFEPTRLSTLEPETSASASKLRLRTKKQKREAYASLVRTTGLEPT